MNKRKIESGIKKAIKLGYQLQTTKADGTRKCGCAIVLAAIGNGLTGPRASWLTAAKRLGLSNEECASIACAFDEQERSYQFYHAITADSLGPKSIPAIKFGRYLRKYINNEETVTQ